MECRCSLRTLHTPVKSAGQWLLIAATAWLGCSWSAVALAETKGLARRDLGLASTCAVAGSWCDVRLPAEPAQEHDMIRAASSAPRPCFANPGYGGGSSDALQSPLLAAGDGLEANGEANSRRPVAPLQLTGDGSSLGGDAATRLNALVADIRGTTTASASGDLASPANTIAAIASTSSTSTFTPASRTEPALWALGAIAICGLGVAGLSAPWLATRFTPARKGWKP